MRPLHCTKPRPPVAMDAGSQMIRTAADAASAKAALMKRIGLTEPQAVGVLALTLRRLTQLDSDQYAEEERKLLEEISILEVRAWPWKPLEKRCWRTG